MDADTLAAIARHVAQTVRDAATGPITNRPGLYDIAVIRYDADTLRAAGEALGAAVAGHTLTAPDLPPLAALACLVGPVRAVYQPGYGMTGPDDITPRVHFSVHAA